MTHGHPKHEPDHLPVWAKPFHNLAHATWFVNLITGVIVIASALAGMQTYESINTNYGPTLDIVDKGIIAIFVIELLVRLMAYGTKPWRFFLDGWNVFDFIIVVACLWPTEGGGNQFATVLRLARLLRAMRLFSAIPRLQVMIVALIRSIPAIFYVGLLLFLQFYIYAVIGTVVFGKNDPIHFGTLDISLLSLFRVVTLEDWTDVMYWQIYGSNITDPQTLANITNPDFVAITTGYKYNDQATMMSPEQLATYSPKAFSWVATTYFVSFVMIGTMIVLNLFIGVVLSGMDEAQKDQAAKVLTESAGGKDFSGRIGGIENRLSQLLEELSEVRRSMPQAKDSATDTDT
ncbi:MAG: voltage-gated sodium channel [Phycisphaerales bacterium]|jgi:voltage-gated sodium channel